MVFRKPGTLLPLERRILQAMTERASEGVHGFALAQEIAEAEAVTSLVSHGTLYKALDRLRGRGLLVAEWEDPVIAEADGRPRRRLYWITAEGALALRQAQAEAASRRLGEAPA